MGYVLLSIQTVQEGLMYRLLDSVVLLHLGGSPQI